MKKIIIIGEDSYLFQGMEYFIKDFRVLKLRYNNWFNYIDEIKKADCVINFCIAPDFSQKDIPISNIIDIQIAKKLSKYTHFFFISSRTVYGFSDKCNTYTEKDIVNPQNHYAQNKIKTELELTNILGDKLTICRISNVIGEPIKRVGYKTFIGWICENINNYGHLEVDFNPNTEKDFISKNFLHKVLSTMLSIRPTGIYNISAGFAVKISEILENYVGKEKIFYKNKDAPLRDQFILDNSKLKDLLNINFTKEILLEDIQKQRILLNNFKCITK